MLNRNELSDAFGRLSDDLLEETDRARQSGGEMPGPGPRRLGRTALVFLAAASLMVLGAVSAYSRWHMPSEGDTYRGEMIETTQVTHYPVPSGSMDPEGEEPLSDEWFISQAATVLAAVNKEETEASQLTLTRQIHQMWDREEVVVTFADGGHGDVTFDARSGYLIHVTAFDREVPEEGTPMAEEDALAVARSWYDALPYARGYEFQYVEKFDDHAWMFEFGKPIQVELWGEELTLLSAYEQVRITIDPCTGTFQLSNCFYVPLLDDHGPGEEPITQEEALAIVMEASPNLKDYELVSAQVAVCLPRPGWPLPSEEEPEGTNAPDTTESTTVDPSDMVNLRYYPLTRLGWDFVFEYQPEDSPFASGVHVCVDLYTGEVLSWEYR